MQTSFSIPLSDLSGVRLFDVPTHIINRDLLSDTSMAEDCFVNQRFSNKLQVYLVNYVYNTNSHFNLNG